MGNPPFFMPPKTLQTPAVSLRASHAMVAANKN